MEIRDTIRKIDLQRLAGISTILGVDLTENYARVVEIQKVGYSLDRFRLNLKPLQSCTIHFPPNTSWTDKGNILKSALAEKGIKSKYAVSCVQSLGVKVVQAVVPIGIRNVAEWITENQEKLLRLPVASSQIVNTFEILSETENDLNVEISFVRSEDIQNHRIFFQQANLQLIALSAGIRDAFNIVRLMSPEPSSVTANFLKNNKVFSTTLQGNKRFEAINVENVNSNSFLTSPDDTIQKVVCGYIGDMNSSSFFKPLGLESEYSLAVGLALKGFLPDINTNNIIPAKEKEQFEKIVYKSLFQRIIMTVGTVILCLLLLSTVLEYFISTKLESLEAELIANGNSYTEIQTLEKQVKELENQLHGKGAAIHSSNLAPLIHQIAEAAPQELWFYRVKEESGQTGGYHFSVYGYTTDEDKVTEFLKNLGEKGIEANLIRSGNPQQNETSLPVQGKRSFVTFEMKLLSK